ncbi:alpha/beta hydrolase domain-containing protein [Nonomuraea polychroma]|uniref:alpha/beta hydrolase domain-containing protein n=1 Tax=Nonomuraea polychroma TaxID=46176 RepID=UPI0013E37D2B|nr:alpha/beta hydrolase domain-containing protein [Nonomuraea polychroma]
MHTSPPDLRPCRGGSGRPFDASRAADVPHGYIEEEHLLSGTATAYRDDPAEPGQVGVRAHAPYVTRILTRTPEPRERFNGTVVVEWFNVSGFMDAGVEWLYTHTELMRGGYAWVGVSAQCAGVTGSELPPDGAAPGGLKAWDPDRYGTLHHPGDDYSYDIFSQAGHAIAELFPGARLIAAGLSLAAYQLTTYINKIDPIARAYHGYLVHSRIGPASLLELPDPPQMDPRPVPFRDDLGNALGGIRTPWMDAPTAVLTGISPNDGLIERLFGQTIPFTDATLARLYPGGADDYLAAFGTATDAAVAKGFLLEADTNEIKALATAAYQAAHGRIP